MCGHGGAHCGRFVAVALCVGRLDAPPGERRRRPFAFASTVADLGVELHLVPRRQSRLATAGQLEELAEAINRARCARTWLTLGDVARHRSNLGQIGHAVTPGSVPVRER